MRVIFRKNFNKISTQNFKIYFHKFSISYTNTINKILSRKYFKEIYFYQTLIKILEIFALALI